MNLMEVQHSPASLGRGGCVRVSLVCQPGTQLGTVIADILEHRGGLNRITFVSAFVGLRAVLRMRESFLRHIAHRTHVRLVIGIDLGGTSREVLEELLRWRCDVLVFHNPIGRSTFHPKAFLFEAANQTTLLLGSNNWTDGGLFSNYEAATRFDFDLPDDDREQSRILEPLTPFVHPEGPTVRQLNEDLIRTLIARGQLPTEEEARRNRGRSSGGVGGGDIPPNPFSPVVTPMAPLLNPGERGREPAATRNPRVQRRAERPVARAAERVLLWRKVLPRSDALQVDEGTAHVGGVRLTQARFESPPGQRINQTTYFRQLFADYEWERETGRHRNVDQEHAFVPMRLIIRGTDYGVRDFEISHKPSGEAGQDNYTTILRWGRDLIPTVQELDLTGATLSLYGTPDAEAPFLIEVA